jgi:hypothetical protein
MNNDLTLIIFASWEPRFWLGFNRLLDEEHPSRILMLFYEEFAGQTQDVRSNVQNLAASRMIELSTVKLAYENPIEAWKLLYAATSIESFSMSKILVDITTMPREIIWTLFSLTETKVDKILWAYHRPSSYSTTWLSRDPSRPRIVAKMGGIAKIGAPNILVLVSGFDAERTKQLILFFEPDEVHIGIQTGTQFNNQTMNAQKHNDEFCTDSEIHVFDVDAYADDQGFTTVANVIMPRLAETNVLLASLGPKLSAVSLYRIHKEYPSVGLVYAPLREFNPEYSSGISNTIRGELK